MRSLRVLPDDAPPYGADFFIGAVGYEQRSRHFLENHRPEKCQVVGLKFNALEVFDYSLNLQTFRSASAIFVPGEPLTASQALVDLLSNRTHQPDSGRLSIVIDISVMSRIMMANVICALWQISQREEVHVRCVYSPATFSQPEDSWPMTHAGPVRPEFAGWTAHPERPLHLIMGLGYEKDLAVGAVSFLEPTKAYLFYPKGLDERYFPLVQEEGQKLSEFISSEAVVYQLDKWAQSFSLLRRMVSQMLAEHRVVIVPFGPKTFAWNAMCIAMLDEFPGVAVWRFSAGQKHQPVNRIAQGPIFDWRFIIDAPLG